mmetsp:Transcript_18625/g.53711  ORF Transcript_18625/g.53711 Transcript_18625/m.53711 type:complete len:140 (+) Transcript_18625:665-1084(+)
MPPKPVPDASPHAQSFSSRRRRAVSESAAEGDVASLFSVGEPGDPRLGEEDPPPSLCLLLSACSASCLSCFRMLFCITDSTRWYKWTKPQRNMNWQTTAGGTNARGLDRCDAGTASQKREASREDKRKANADVVTTMTS